MGKRKKFASLLEHDIREGILRQWIYFAVAAVFFSVCLLVFYFEISEYFKSTQEVYPGIEGFIAYIFAGNKPLDTIEEGNFSIPFVWIVFHLLLMVLTAFYASNDISNSAAPFMIRVKSKTKWWIGKYCWCILTVILYYAMLFIICTLFCLFFSKEFSFVGSIEIYEDFLEVYGTDYNGITLFLNSFVISFCVSLAMSLLLMTATLFVKPIYALIIMIVYLVATVYYCSPFLIYNYSILCRNSEFSQHNINFLEGLIICLVVAIGSFVVGIIKMKRKDIL